VRAALVAVESVLAGAARLGSERMSVGTRTLGGLGLLGVALVIVGLIIGAPTVGIEGAYFNRSIGTPTYSSVFRESGTGFFNPSDGNLWIGAGIAILVLVCAGLVLRRSGTQARRSESST
jgi:hypothetical protein